MECVAIGAIFFVGIILYSVISAEIDRRHEARRKEEARRRYAEWLDSAERVLDPFDLDLRRDRLRSDGQYLKTLKLLLAETNIPAPPDDPAAFSIWKWIPKRKTVPTKTKTHKTRSYGRSRRRKRRRR